MFLKNFIVKKNDTVNEKTSIQEVLDRMYLEKLHYVVLIKEKKPIGIITESDIIKLFNSDIDFNDPVEKYALKELILLHDLRLLTHALSIMIDNNIGHLVVINNDNEYVGCVEHENIVYKLENEINKSNITLKQLLTVDSKAPVIHEDSKIEYILDFMESRRITSVLVSKDTKPYGIISERDILKLAQQGIDKKSSIKPYVQSPLIIVDSNDVINVAVQNMQKHNIRRVISSDEDNNYYIINSKSLLKTLKGNYTSFLESKLFDARDTFNGLSEYVIEVLDLSDSEQVIFWTNGITKINFNVNIDDNITQVIPPKLWNEIYRQLKADYIIYQIIQIDNKWYQLKGHYGTLMDDNIIKLFLSDITEITKLNMELQKQNEIQEKLLFNQAKLVQMGKLIGDIAHQWQEPLNRISIASSGMQMKKEYDLLSDDEFIHLTENITSNAVNLADTVEVFKKLVNEDHEMKKVVLQERLDIALNIVRTRLKNNNIQLINKIDYETSMILEMISGELDQVIITLLNNTIEVLLKREIKNPWIQVCCTKNTHTILITIEDNAKGIQNDLIEKIVNNEYKYNKDTTGVGLYLGYKIITQSLKGTMGVENTDEGAKFFIELPI